MLKRNLVKFVFLVNSYLKRSGIGRSALVRYLRKGVYRLLMRIVAPDDVYLTRSNDIQMYVYTNTVSFHDYVLQSYEPYTTELFKQAVKPRAVVVDIGAQFGYFSLIAAKLAGSQGRVYSFEPSASNFKLLKDNIRLNNIDNITPFQKAVGESSSVVTLFIYQGSDSHGMYPRPDTPVKERVEIECVALDQFLPHETTDIVKIDIEGHEPYALAGMKHLISRNKHLILFTELVPGFLRQAGVECQTYLDQIEALGFQIRLIDEDRRRLVPVERSLVEKQDAFWHANLYCVKDN